MDFSNPLNHPSIAGGLRRTGKFLRWWGNELLGLLPEKWRSRVHQSRHIVVGQFAGQAGGWRVLLVEEGGQKTLLEIEADRDQELTRGEASSLFNHDDYRSLERIYLVPEDDVLKKTLRLPAATEGNLDQALRFEMDRHTPFRAEDVYADYVVVDRHNANNEIEVELVLIPRDELQHQHEQMQALGLLVHRASIGPVEQPLDINLLPQQWQAEKHNERAQFNWALAGALVAVLVACMVGSIWLHDQRLDRLEERQQVVRQEAQAVAGLKRALEDRVESAQFLTQKRLTTPALIETLKEITRVLPDDTYLQSLQLENSRLLLYGYTDRAERLLELVNSADGISEASFARATQADARTGKDQFTLAAQVQRENLQTASIDEGTEGADTGGEES